MSLLLRFLTRQNIILLITLTALACLPFAIRALAPDATVGLLLPVAIAGVVIAWWLAPLELQQSSLVIIYLVAGPLAIFIFVGGILRPLFDTTSQALQALPQLVDWLRVREPIDLSAWSAAQQDLAARVGALAARILTWTAGRLRGEAVQDPAARAFAWSLGLWLIAAWAGSRMRSNLLRGFGREKSALIAILPATALLAWTLRATSQLSAGLWIHLTALVLLLALAHYESQARRWRDRRMDYSDSIWEDTMIATGLITVTVIVASYLSYSVSLEEVRERIREWDERRARASTADPAPGGDGPSGGAVTGQGVGRLHTISAGPLLSSDIAMIVSTGDLPAVPVPVDLDVPYYYWRTMTYQRYIGSGWTNPVSQDMDLPAGRALLEPTAGDLQGYRAVHQEVTFTSTPPGNLYWTGTLMQANVPIQLTHRGPNLETGGADLDSLLEMDLTGALTSAESYSADSLISVHSENSLRAARPVYPAWVTERYLDLPDSVPERVLALARELTATAPSPYDRAVAIETYLRQIPYNLDVPAPPAGRDVADFFIFDLRQGYCDYHATAMTVLARAAGLPARFVVGYANGSYNSIEAHYVVTQADSHAWTEIYFTGIGWVEFEPTPSQPAPVRSGTVDVPAFEPAGGAPFRWPAVADWIGRGVDLLWRSALIAAALYLGWLASENLRISRLDPAESLRHIYWRLWRMTRAVNNSQPISQTPAEYASIVSARLDSLRGRGRVIRWLLAPASGHIAALIALYAESMFSPRPAGRAEARAASRAWTSLRWRLGILNVLILLRLGRFTST